MVKRRTEEPAREPESFLGTLVRGERDGWRISFAAMRGAWLPLLAIVLVAGALRLYQIGEPERWIDEIAIAQDAMAGTNKIVSPAHRFHLPVVGWFMNTFGDSNTSLRLWSWITGSLAVALCGLFGAALRDRTFGIAFAAMAALHPYFILYAQDGNYYSTMFLHTMVQALAAVAFLRGAMISGKLLILLSAYLSFYNHPFGIVFTAFLLLSLAVAWCLSPALRAPLFGPQAPAWIRKALLPAAVAIVALVAFVLRAKLSAAASFVLGKLSLGGSLTNVEFGLPFIADTLTSWGVSFFREWSFAPILGAVVFAAWCVGVALLFREARHTRDRVTVWAAFFSFLLPIATFALVFSLDVKRTFYIRYITFLVPFYLLPVAVALAARAKVCVFRPKDESRWLRAAAVIAAPLAILQAPFLFHYYRVDSRNYAAAAEYLAAHWKTGDQVWAVDQMESTRYPWHFKNNKLPTGQPDVFYSVYGERSAVPLYASALRYALPGRRLWVDNSWRQRGTDAMYAELEAPLTPAFIGTSHQGAYQQARLLLHDGGVPSGLSQTKAGTPLPTMEPRHRIAAGELAAFPDHPDTHLRSLEAENDIVWRDRDGSFDYMVHQPAGAPRQLVLRAVTRSEQDLAENPARRAETVDNPELWLLVSVNGVHRGTWRVPPAPRSILRIPTGIELPEGNHRISIGGTTMRGRHYKPYNPWSFGGLEWNAERETPKPSLEAEGTVRLAAGLGAPQPWSFNNGLLANGWSVIGRSNGALSIDEKVIGPSGHPALRLDIPQQAAGSITVLSPPFPVEPGEFVLFSTHVSSRSNPRQEWLPVIYFLDGHQRPIGSIPFVPIPAVTGTHLHGYWQRIAAMQQAPPGATAAAVGFTHFPREINYEPLAGSFFIDAFASPQAGHAYRDPVCPLLTERSTTATANP